MVPSKARTSDRQPSGSWLPGCVVPGDWQRPPEASNRPGTPFGVAPHKARGLPIDPLAARDQLAGMRSPGRTVGTFAVAALLCSAACRSQLAVPSDAQLDCTSGTCPAGWTCNTHIGRCVLTDQIDAVPPALAGAAVVTPSLVRVGITARVAFDVTEDLRVPPRVVLRAGFDRALTILAAESSARHFVFTYQPVGDEPQDQDCPVVVDLEDLQGLQSVGLAAGSIRFAFSPPVLYTVALSGSPARAGATLRLAFTTSEALASDPVVHLGAGRNMARDPASSGTSWVYAYVSDGTEPEDPAGVPLSIDLVDLAGNAATGLAAGAAVFDRTPPGLAGAPAIAPGAAAAGTLVRVTFTASEDLGADPVVRLGGIALDKGAQAGRSYTYGHVAAPADGEGPKGLSIDLVDRAGNVSGALGGGTVSFDFTPPSVTALTLCDDDGSAAPCAADQRTFSARPGHDRMKISFAVSEAPAALQVSVGIDALGAGGQDGCASADGLAWICRHPVGDPFLGTAPRVESAPVSVAVEDAAGNGGTAGAFATLDFQPPSLAGVPYFERCDAYAPARVAANDLWVKPVASFGGPGCPFSGCGLTGPVRVHLTLDEPASLGPGGLALDDGTPILLDTCQSTATQLVGVLAADAAPGDRRVLADVADARGNGSLLELGRLRVDRAAPPPPDTGTAGRVVYRRFPWGADVTSGAKAFFLDGSAGAVAPGATVVVYDGPDPARAAQVGRALADATGAFGAPPGAPGALALAVGDLPEVFLVQEDAAGNQSPPALVWDAEWTATTGFRQQGSSTLNPHLFAAEPAWRASRDTPAQLEPARPGDVATRAGAGVATSGQPDLRMVTASTSVPGPRGHCAMAYDPAAGRSLLFGGAWSIYAVGSFLGSDTWSFDGTSWTQLLPVASPPARKDAALAHDAARGRFVLFGGSGSAAYLGDTWELDGSSWQRVCWPGCAPGIECTCTRMPSPRYGPAAFFDPVNGRVTLFGGQDATGPRNDTWTWDGADWTELQPAHPPPAQVSASAAVSPELGLAMITLANGTWLWDGADWSGSSSLPLLGGTDVWWDPADAAFHAYFAAGNLMQTWDGAAWNMVTPPPSFGVTTMRTLYGYTCGAFDRERGAYARFGGCVDGSCRIDYSSNQITGLLSVSAIRQIAPGVAPAARSGAAAAEDPPDGVAWLAGGKGLNRYPFLDNWTWDGATWAGDGGTASFDGLWGMSLAHIGNGRLLRFGGASTGGGAPSGPPISTYLRVAPGWTFTQAWGGYLQSYFEPAAWLSAGATDQALALDEASGLAVYFRGDGSGTFTGQWVDNYEPWLMTGAPSGILWTAMSPSTSPTSVTGHRMAYCPGAGGLVLFGGADGTGALLDRTWTWDGATWHEVLPAARPPARADHVLFCDRERGRIEIAGGQGAAGDLEDVWEFDGTSWTQRFPAERPSPRHGASAAFLTGQGRGVIFGGERLAAYLGDTWTWDGGRDRRPAHVFHARFAAAGADPAAVESVSVAWDAGATSFAAGPPPLSGTALHVWDRGIWRPTGVANGAGPSSPGALAWSTATDPEWTAQGAALAARLRRLLVGPEREVAFAVAPLGTNRDHLPGASLASRYVEVSVRYRLACLPSGQKATSPQRCCSGVAAAGTCQ